MQNPLKIFENLKYQYGFGNSFFTEVLEGAVPTNQNSPVKLKYGLFAEQLSGTAFTVKRSESSKVWHYKLRPSAIQGQYKRSQFPFRIVSSYLSSQNVQNTPNQLRWKAIPSIKEGKVTFVQGLVSLLGAGEPSLKQGVSIYAFSANESMKNEAFYNSDGDFLIVPQSGTLFIKTTHGLMTVKPREICVIPRGVKFSVEVEDEIKGWISQIYGHHFTLPELGPIGANGLANPGDFQSPIAWFEDKKQEWKIYNKYIGQIYECKSDFSPFDVVGWKGNYSPYKYNLDNFNTIGSISFDHPDPSIFTVLTARSAMQGTAALDFVIFPTRWLVADHTFKPPYYHRNCMSQFMGNVCGEYDAKGEGFGPGCSSLHSTMTPHGPDADAYEKFVTSEQKPFKIPEKNLAFMFESGYMLKTSTFALDQFLEVDHKYHKCWQRLKQIKYSSEQSQ